MAEYYIFMLWRQSCSVLGTSQHAVSFCSSSLYHKSRCLSSRQTQYLVFSSLFSGNIHTSCVLPTKKRHSKCDGFSYIRQLPNQSIPKSFFILAYMHPIFCDHYHKLLCFTQQLAAALIYRKQDNLNDHPLPIV